MVISVKRIESPTSLTSDDNIDDDWNKFDQEFDVYLGEAHMISPRRTAA